MRKEYNKLIVNTWLLMIGQFASRLLSMLFVPFYTLVLTTSDYGISDLITTSSSLLFPFTTLAIGEAIMRFSQDKDANHKSVYSTGLSIFSIGFLLVLCSVPVIQNTVIGDYTGFFILYFFLHVVGSLTMYFIQGLGLVKICSISGLVHTAGVIVCNILFLLYYKLGIVGYLLSFIIGQALTLIYQFFAGKLYKYIIPAWKIDKSLLKKMLVYSIPIIPNSIAWWISNSSDKYILNFFTDTAQVGIYSISYKIPTIIMTIMGLFMNAWKLSAVDDFGTEKSKSFYSSVYNNCFIINILLASFLIITSKFFASFLYQKEFFVAWKYAPVLIIANVLNVMATFLGTIYTSAKKTKNLSLSVIVSALSNIILNFVLIPFIGAMGAAIATAISYMIIWLIRLIDTRKIMIFQISHKRDIILLIIIILETLFIIIDTPISQFMGFVLFVGIMIYFRKYLLHILLQSKKWLISKLKKQSPS